MIRRVSPTDRLRAEINELFASDQGFASVLEGVGQLTVRLLMQEVIEAEIDVFLGRHRYQPRTEEHPAGHRNGWQPPASVKTTMGPVEPQRPKLRGTDGRFCSQLFGMGVTRTNALEALVVSAWVQGLFGPDSEAALGEVLGDEAALSRSTVSRICQQVKDDFAAQMDGFRSQWERADPAGCLSGRELRVLDRQPPSPHGELAQVSSHQPDRTDVRGDEEADEGHGPTAGRMDLCGSRLRRPRPSKPGLARYDDDAVSAPTPAGPAPTNSSIRPQPLPSTAPPRQARHNMTSEPASRTFTPRLGRTPQL